MGGGIEGEGRAFLSSLSLLHSTPGGDLTLWIHGTSCSFVSDQKLRVGPLWFVSRPHSALQLSQRLVIDLHF